MEKCSYLQNYHSKKRKINTEHYLITFSIFFTNKNGGGSIQPLPPPPIKARIFKHPKTKVKHKRYGDTHYFWHRIEPPLVSIQIYLFWLLLFFAYFGTVFFRLGGGMGVIIISDQKKYTFVPPLRRLKKPDLYLTMSIQSKYPNLDLIKIPGSGSIQNNRIPDGFRSVYQLYIFKYAIWGKYCIWCIFVSNALNRSKLRNVTFLTAKFEKQAENVSTILNSQIYSEFLFYFTNFTVDSVLKSRNW